MKALESMDVRMMEVFLKLLRLFCMKDNFKQIAACRTMKLINVDSTFLDQEYAVQRAAPDVPGKG